MTIFGLFHSERNWRSYETMKRTDRIKFDSPFTKQLYLEISAIRDVSVINRPYITRDYMWAVWQKIYKENFGCTRYILYNNEKGA